MDQSYSESDVSMSPTQVLDRLQILRQLQLMQRGKLQKQCLQYHGIAENSSSITEIISHFTNSTSYNTFRSLLQSPRDSANEDSSSLLHNRNTAVQQRVEEKDFIDGVSILNVSQESEFVVNSPVSSKSSTSVSSRAENAKQLSSNGKLLINVNTEIKTVTQKQISLDDIPIISPKKDFDALIIEKLRHDKDTSKECIIIEDHITTAPKKRLFLRRGEGMARFGLNKNALVIQNTKSLPWKSKSSKTNSIKTPKQSKPFQSHEENRDGKIIITEPKQLAAVKQNVQLSTKQLEADKPKLHTVQVNRRKQNTNTSIDHNNCELQSNELIEKIIEFPKGKDSLVTNKGKTWASVLTKEQNDFLCELKQSDYYKNFASPAKSTISDQSCNENNSKLRQEKEVAEQNMFELLEKKVTNDSFNLENSFFNRFLKKNNHDSGESTPLMMQKCLFDNPGLLHILPNLKHKQRIDQSQSEVETCASVYTECCSDTCSSVSSCCSCKTVEQAINSNYSNYEYMEKNKNINEAKRANNTNKIMAGKETENKESQENNVINNEVMTANMVEMNAKLITTSELLKERLCELEDEIETFRKENANLLKLRQEVDLDKQKFYEDKKAFEQKLNEEKILSEYYLAEEKEKLTKQKQTYERYVREIKGRLIKKDKDEVISLKKEIENLKEEIRNKDAKSTSTIARLRNQIKIIEKEKKDLLDGCEKLKKENRRIEHSNDITRRLTNMKYLAEINKKLSNMTSKESRSEVNIDSDAKYKTFEIERQSRSKKVQPSVKGVIRPRAKSVPNVNVTSRYARYFSQRDCVSQKEQNKLVNADLDTCTSDNEESVLEDDNEINNFQDQEYENITSDDEKHLEKLYMETFRSTSPKNSLSSINSYTNQLDKQSKSDNFFLHKGESSVKVTKSPSQRSRSSFSKSPISVLNHRSNNKSPSNSEHSTEFVANLSGGSNNSSNRTKSAQSFSNHSIQSQRTATVINNSLHSERLMAISPEPSTSATSLNKTNLNPTEIKKPDGSKELRFCNGNVKHISADGKYSKFMYYNGDVKENFYNEGRIKYYYSETKTFHTTHADGLEVLEFPDGQIEKRYKDGSTEVRLPNGSIRYFDPKNEHVREEWRFPDGTALTISANGEQRVVFRNGQIEVHAQDHKRREFPDGTVKLVYNDGTSETRYASGRVRIKDKHGNLIMDSTPGS